VAEVIYYGLFPGLLVLRRMSSSWAPLILTSVAMAIMLAATNPVAGNYPSFGNGLNWLLGLPCWLSGCWPAEKSYRMKSLQLCQPTPSGSGTYRYGDWQLYARFSVFIHL